MKHLDILVDTGTKSDHYLVTAVVDTAGLPSTSVPLVKEIVRNLKQINFELLRYDLEQSDIIQLVLQCQNLNDSVVVLRVGHKFQYIGEINIRVFDKLLFT